MTKITDIGLCDPPTLIIVELEQAPRKINRGWCATLQKDQSQDIKNIK